MKKFCKFIAGTLSLVAVAGGVIYFMKNVINKDSKSDFDDFDDDFEDELEQDDSSDDTKEADKDDNARGYVTLTRPETSDSTTEQPENEEEPEE